MRNGYRTGHTDVSCMYFLIDAFMLQRDGVAPGTCAQRGLFSNRRRQLFSLARHVDAPQITFSEALQTPTNSSTELPTVHTLDKHSARPCHFLLSKHKQVLSYRQSMNPSCLPTAGLLQRKYKSHAGLSVTALRIAHGTF